MLPQIGAQLPQEEFISYGRILTLSIYYLVSILLLGFELLLFKIGF